MTSTVNVGKFVGAEKVVQYFGSKSIAYKAGMQYLASLEVDSAAYEAYNGENPVAEMQGVDEIIHIMRTVGKMGNSGNCPKLRKEIQARIDANGVQPSTGSTAAPEPDQASIEDGSGDGDDSESV